MPKIENTISPSTTSGWKKFLKDSIKILLVAIVLYVVYLKLSENWAGVVNYSWTLNIPLLLLSVLMHLLTFLLFSRVWCILIKAFGYDVSLKHAFKISYITNLGRYIPGKIWPVFGMMYYAKKIDISREVAISSWIVAQIFTIPPSLLAGFLCIVYSPEIMTSDVLQFLNIWVYLAAAAIFLFSILLIVAPNKVFSLFNIILRKIGRQEIQFEISVKTALYVYFGYFICWLCYGFAFWLFLSSIVANISLPVIPTVGSFILAYQIGYLALFAPGGIGVRELVITVILTPYLGSITAGVAIAARIWNMIVEIIAASIAWSIRFSQKKV
ncbi:MAG: lysylphosphatidylglycerol synthase transmembrane domain-containing protein [bacterium]